jgi:hypothetical protein
MDEELQGMLVERIEVWLTTPRKAPQSLRIGNVDFKLHLIRTTVLMQDYCLGLRKGH